MLMKVRVGLAMTTCTKGALGESSRETPFKRERRRCFRIAVTS
jgi:hypothetical protein